jgi:hypothetical protein
MKIKCEFRTCVTRNLLKVCYLSACDIVKNFHGNNSGTSVTKNFSRKNVRSNLFEFIQGKAFM